MQRNKFYQPISNSQVIGHLCDTVFEEVNALSTQNGQRQIVNASLTSPLSAKECKNPLAFEERYTRWSHDLNQLQQSCRYILNAALFMLLARSLFNVVMRENTLKQDIVLCAVAMLFYWITLKQLRYSGKFEKRLRFLLPEPIQNQCRLVDLWRISSKQAFLVSHRMKTDFNENIELCLLQGIAAVKYQTFDCVALTALSFFKLLQREVPLHVEWRIPRQLTHRQHSYLVLNRREGQRNNPNSWNEDTVIFDLWYQVKIFMKTLRRDPQFFTKYPLLQPTDEILLEITPDAWWKTRNKLIPFQALLQNAEKSLHSTAPIKP